MKTKCFLIVVLLFGLQSQTYAAWFYDAYGVVNSNVCRYGPYWQFVPYAPIGSPCFMPGHGISGVRVME